MLQTILDLLFSEKALGVAAAALLGFLGKFAVSAIRRRNVALAVYHAFHIVEDLADSYDDGSLADKALDKAKAGLQAADDYLKANGWRPLKPGEQQVALLKFKALHGEDIVAEHLATTAGKPPPS